MKTFLLFVAFAAFLALTYGYKRRGHCGGHDDEDDHDDCGCGMSRHNSHSCGGHHYGHRYSHGHDGGCGHNRHDAGHGCGGHSRKHHGHHEEEEEEHDDHVYRFQVGDATGAYEYLDDEGHLRGFNIDLLLAVCKKAGKKCAYMRDTYENCWKSVGDNEYPGYGIMAGFYEGCVGMFSTTDRLNSFNFTVPFTPNVKAALFWREKDDVGDRKNITGRKIGFVEGWAMSARCLKRQHDFAGHDHFHAVVFKSPMEMVHALENKEVDAITGLTIFKGSKYGFVAEEPHFQCTTAGLSVMTHYYSDVIEWWNHAFAELQESGEFKELCEDGKKTHASRGNITCA